MSIFRKIREKHGTGFSVGIAGDFCPRGKSRETAEMAGEIVKEILPDFSKCDVKILQWEVAITTDDTPIIKSGPNHKCEPVALEFAKALGADILLFANNHIGDFGPDAVMQAIGYAEEAGFAVAGAGKNASDAAKPLKMNVKGIPFAIFNSCEHEFGIAGRNFPGCAGTDPYLLEKAVREVKEEGYLVLTALHGGTEHYPFPTPRMVKLFRGIASAGADAVFNTHTHCPLGAEIFRNTPIVASSGNFYFPPANNKLHNFLNWHLGYLAIYHFDKDGAWALEILPYVQKPGKIRPLSAGEEKEFEQYFEELCKPFADMEYCEDLFESWCWRKSGFSSYFSMLFDQARPEEFSAPETIRKLMPIRNLFHCESHCELIRTCFRLVEERRTETAGRWEEMILSCQNPAWLKKLLLEEKEL